MSFIAVKNFNLDLPLSFKNALLTSAAKGLQVDTRLKMLHLCCGHVHTRGVKYIVNLIADKTKEKIERNNTKMNAATTRIIAEFIESANAILDDNVNELPSKTIGRVIEAIKAMNHGAGLKFVDVRNELDNMLYKQTVKCMAFHPERADIILEEGVKALNKSIKAVDEFNLPLRAKSKVLHSSVNNFDELKGLFELVNHAEFKKFEHGLSANVPPAMIESYRKSFTGIMQGRDLLNNTKNILSIVDFYRIRPTGPSGLNVNKSKPPAVSSGDLIKKMTTLINEGDTKGVKNLVYKYKHEVDSTFPMKLLEVTPEAASLLNMPKFNGDLSVILDSLVRRIKNDKNINAYINHLNLKSSFLGPEVLYEKAFNYEPSSKKNIETEVSLIKNLPEFQSEIAAAWESAYPGAGLDAIVIDHEVYSPNEHHQYVRVYTKKPGIKL